MWPALSNCGVRIGGRVTKRDHIDSKIITNTTITTDATLFREEAERARRYAAAMTNKKIIDRLNEIATLYDELAAGQNPGPTERE